MQVPVLWSSKVSEKFAELTICIGIINDVHVEKENEQIQELEKAVYEKVRTKYNIETLKDNPTVRAYRDSDHTKITRQTGNVLVVGYGAPGITEPQLKETVETTISYIKLVSGGETKMTKVFKNQQVQSRKNAKPINPRSLSS